MMYKILCPLATSRRQIAFTSLAFLCIILGGMPARAFSWNLLLTDEGYASVSDGTWPDGTRYQSVYTQFNNVGQLNGPSVLLRQGDDFNASLFLSGTVWSIPRDAISTQLQLDFYPTTTTSTFSERGYWNGKMSLYMGSNLIGESQPGGYAADQGGSSSRFYLSSSIGPANGSPVEIGGLTFDTVIFEGKYSGQPAAVRFADVYTTFSSFSYTAVPEPSIYAMALAALACGGWQMFRRRKLASSLRLLLLCAVIATAVGRSSTYTLAQSVNYELVPVGNPGNANDSTGYGTVNYEYQIGKYNVTIGQYTDFLNAKAQTDAYLLYDDGMASNLNSAGISRSGTSGGYSYSAIGPSGITPAGAISPGNRPITYISWFDAARFANWMQNGQGSGSTETGAYTLVGGLTSGTAPEKNPDAQFYIPTENQWYKAAYYSPVKGGVGTPGYYTYATQSDLAPGNTIGSGPNQANYYIDRKYAVTRLATYSASQNYLTDVGAFSGSGSFYGTFDQSGNVYQWNDLDGTAGSFRGIRAQASFRDDPWNLSNLWRSEFVPSLETGAFGFRLAAPVAVPEPSTCASLAAGCVFGCWHVFKGRRRRTASGVSRSLVALLLATCSVIGGTAHAQVTIDWVTVGDPGNTADTTGDPNPAGAVADSFQIMKYEFTNQQYTDFLNSVAATDTYSLYYSQMGSDARGGITQSGSSGSYTYATKTNMGDKPVYYVSWFDAARVSNWLMNGATGTSSTETGAYTLNNATSGNAPAVNSGATFYIPTENQWYKAAYYKGGNTNAGYWDYATQSDTAPTAVTAGSTGIGSSGSTGNFANYNAAADWNGKNGNVTTVGTNGGASAYGAFDMSGNLREWNDLTGAAGSSRGLRGGNWDYIAYFLSSSNGLTSVPSDEGSDNGFRLASPVTVPEPSTYAMALAGVACGGYSLFRRRKRG